MKKIMSLVLVSLILVNLIIINVLAIPISLSVPTVKQPYNSNWCWAASGASMAIFKGKSTNVSDFAFKAKYTSDIQVTGNVNDVRYGLSQLGVSSTTSLYSISLVSTHSLLHNSSPIGAGCATGGGVGHMMVIKYSESDFSEASIIRLMDPSPDYSGDRVVKYSDLINGNSGFVWINSIYTN